MYLNPDLDPDLGINLNPDLGQDTDMDLDPDLESNPDFYMNSDLDLELRFGSGAQIWIWNSDLVLDQNLDLDS